jgi:phage anti-repressor protein
MQKAISHSTRQNDLALPANDGTFSGPARVPVCVGSIGGAEVQTVDARALHAFLEIKSDFRNWIKNRIEDFGFANGADFATTVEIYRGGERKDYRVTLDMAKELSMVERTPKGKEARAYFIECERRAVAALTLPDFTNPATAARAWADAVEAQQQARIERDRAIATKAEIGTRREATAMARASVAVREVNRLKAELGRAQTHATIIAVERAAGRKFGMQGWRPLRKWCEAHGQAPQSVHDDRYGEVKAWPADAWGNVYGIDLGELFPVAE